MGLLDIQDNQPQQSQDNQQSQDSGLDFDDVSLPQRSAAPSMELKAVQQTITMSGVSGCEKKTMGLPTKAKIRC